MCGGDGADILCGKCNRYVCRNCFDAGADAYMTKPFATRDLLTAVAELLRPRTAYE